MGHRCEIPSFAQPVDSHDGRNCNGNEEEIFSSVADFIVRSRYCKMIEQCQRCNARDERDEDTDVSRAAGETLVDVELGCVSHRVKEEPKCQSDAGSRDVFGGKRFQVCDNVKSSKNRDQRCSDDSCQRECVADQITDSILSCKESFFIVSPKSALSNREEQSV